MPIYGHNSGLSLRLSTIISLGKMSWINLRNSLVSTCDYFSVLDKLNPMIIGDPIVATSSDDGMSI